MIVSQRHFCSCYYKGVIMTISVHIDDLLLWNLFLRTHPQGEIPGLEDMTISTILVVWCHIAFKRIILLYNCHWQRTEVAI